MLKKLLAQAAKPKKPPSRRALLQTLGFQSALLLFALVIVVFFPERASRLTVFVFMALGISLLLWMETFESIRGIGIPDGRMPIITGAAALDRLTAHYNDTPEDVESMLKNGSIKVIGKITPTEQGKIIPIPPRAAFAKSRSAEALAAAALNAGARPIFAEVQENEARARNLVGWWNSSMKIGAEVTYLKSELEGKIILKTKGLAYVLGGEAVVDLEHIGAAHLGKVEPFFR
jgi:hypothetical protein